MYSDLLQCTLPEKLTDVEPVATPTQLSRRRTYRNTCSNHVQCTHSTLEWNYFKPRTSRHSIFVFSVFIRITPVLRKALSCLLQTDAPQTLIHSSKGGTHSMYCTNACPSASLFTPSSSAETAVALSNPHLYSRSSLLG